MKVSLKKMLLFALSIGLVLCQPLLAYAAKEEVTGNAEEIKGDEAPAVTDGFEEEEGNDSTPDEAAGAVTADGEEPEAGVLDVADEQIESKEPGEAVSTAAVDEASMQAANEDTVGDEDELAQWLAEHYYTGGTVYLSDMVYITDHIAVYGDTSFNIDTGEHGIVFDGATLNLPHVNIIGKGTLAPVLEVARLDNWWDHWNTALQGVAITATGDDAGQGGIALRISIDSPPADPGDFVRRIPVRSYGSGAVGVELVHATDAYCMDIEVNGNGGMAVKAPQGSSIWFSTLRAEGTGAACADDHVFFDTCTSSPEHTNGYNRKITGAQQEHYTPVRLHDEGHLGIAPDGFAAIFTLDGPPGDAGLAIWLEVDWDREAVNRIDAGKTGMTTISGTLASAYAGLGLEDDFSIEAIIDIRDPAFPFIDRVSYGEEDGRNVFYLSFWEEYDLAKDTLRLWRSDDNGKTWKNVAQDGDVVWETYYESTKFSSVIVYYDEITAPAQYIVELVGVGDSNTIVINGEESYSHIGGGDRTGTDRDGEGEDNKNNTPGGTGDDEVHVPSIPKEEQSPSSSGPGTGDNANEGSQSAGSTGIVQARGQSTVSIIDTNSTSTDGTIPVHEWEDETTTVLSGRRLNALARANPGGVTFIKGEATVIVDTAAILALGLTDNQVFTLLLERSAGEFIARFFVDGTEVSLIHSILLPSEDDMPGEGSSEEIPLAPATVLDDSTPLAPGAVGTGGVIAIIIVAAIATATAFVLLRRRWARQ